MLLLRQFTPPTSFKMTSHCLTWPSPQPVTIIRGLPTTFKTDFRASVWPLIVFESKKQQHGRCVTELSLNGWSRGLVSYCIPSPGGSSEVLVSLFGKGDIIHLFLLSVVRNPLQLLSLKIIFAYLNKGTTEVEPLFGGQGATQGSKKTSFVKPECKMSHPKFRLHLFSSRTSSRF